MSLFKMIKKKLTDLVVDDMVNFFENDLGQVAIYDAVNGNSKQRVELAKTLRGKGIKVVFIESTVDNDELLERNIADATKSPDYSDWDSDEAIADYKKRISIVSHSYETMNESHLTYIKFINFGERLLVNESKHDFLTSKIIFYLMNTKIKMGSIYFARCSNNKWPFKSDPPLDDKGKDYAGKLHKAVVNQFKKQGHDDLPSSLVVWTSTRSRTAEMSQVFKDRGLVVRHRPELTQLKPGDAEGLNDQQLQEQFPK
ncbi:unnamed protein product [Ambrosiozyma monospora]|uniref:Unnamed protein product n=1 Tax=Ambrosiozyma monospora TaxID=43982 RepID=A0ACB5TY49_AMBMO|nr:unnamed protein product [Ambrosiozyma monospora]